MPPLGLGPLSGAGDAASYFAEERPSRSLRLLVGAKASKTGQCDPLVASQISTDRVL